MAKRIRKSNEEIREDVDGVLKQNLSIQSVAKDTGKSKSLLAVLVKKTKKCPRHKFAYNRNTENRKTFCKEQEQLLASYLKTTSKMCHV